MKTARYVSITMLGFLIVTARAYADPDPYDPATDPTNPYTQTDPDGVPYSVTLPKAKPLTSDQINAIRKQQAQAALNKNWLLRNYEQQLQARAAKSPNSQSANLYFQLSSNKELAKLAGLPSIDTDAQESPSPYHTGANPSAHGSLTLRSDSPNPPASRTTAFKPLLTPLSSPSSAITTFYTPPPIAMPSPISSGPSQPAPAPKPSSSTESSDLETPGLVSAEKNPMTDAQVSAPDLTLDVLPGETPEQAKAHQDGNLKLELPLPMDANQLHQQQASTLSIPGATKTAQAATPTPAPAKPASTDDEDAPLQVNKAPVINPIRPAIANPYDILNR